MEVLGKGAPVLIEELLRNSRDRSEQLSCLPLLLMRHDGEALLFPEGEVSVEEGDRLLFAGGIGAYERMKWTLENYKALRYVQTGTDIPSGYLWRKFARERHT
jgi:hypothetical protein